MSDTETNVRAAQATFRQAEIRLHTAMLEAYEGGMTVRQIAKLTGLAPSKTAYILGVEVESSVDGNDS